MSNIGEQLLQAQVNKKTKTRINFPYPFPKPPPLTIFVHHRPNYLVKKLKLLDKMEKKININRCHLILNVPLNGRDPFNFLLRFLMKNIPLVISCSDFVCEQIHVQAKIQV